MNTVILTETTDNGRTVVESQIGGALGPDALLCVLIRTHDPFQKEPRAPFAVGEA